MRRILEGFRHYNFLQEQARSREDARRIIPAFRATITKQKKSSDNMNAMCHHVQRRAVTLVARPPKWARRPPSSRCRMICSRQPVGLQGPAPIISPFPSLDTASSPIQTNRFNFETATSEPAFDGQHDLPSHREPFCMITASTM